MKKILSGIFIVTIFTMCNRNKDLQTDKNLVETMDSARMYTNADTAVIVSAPVVTRNATPRRTSTRTRSSGSSGSSASTGTTQTTQKKGWSHAAKGAVIGGVGGAVVGAAVTKQHGKGAIIGGVVGAAGGYIIGRAKDKKENP
jgi:hypothetical protein